MLLLTLGNVVPVHAQSPNDASFLAALGELREATYSDKASIVERLSQGGHPSIRAVLTALMGDRLYCSNNGEKVFIVKSAEEDPLHLIDALSLKDAGSASADNLTQIGTNNALRRTLRTTVAHFALSSPEVTVRLDAVRDMLRSLDDTTVALLRKRLGVETNSSVRKEIATGLALAALDGSDTRARLQAIATLSQSVSQDVRNRLARLLDKSPDGSFVESDEKVRRAAATAVATIDQWRSFYSVIETLFFGLSLGSVLVLIAIGLAITFGVMGVINMAHGELMMLGAYTTYVVQLAMPKAIGVSIVIAIPAAFLVAGAACVFLHPTALQYLYCRPLETLLATFGVSLILQQSVRSIFSALNRSVVTPDWMSGSMRLNDALAITYNRLYIVIFTLLIFSLILLVLKRTRLGLDIRAVSQTRAMPKAMGIRTEWVDART